VTKRLQHAFGHLLPASDAVLIRPLNCHSKETCEAVVLLTLSAAVATAMRCAQGATAGQRHCSPLR